MTSPVTANGSSGVRSGLPRARLGRVIPALCSLLLGGCLASAPFEAPAPAERAALSARIASDSTDVEAVTTLAVLDLLDDRPGDALAVLQAVERHTDDALLPVLTALAAERNDAPGSAWARYDAYTLRYGGALGTWASMRRAAVEPVAVRRAIRERLATPTPSAAPTGATERVVVLPFAHDGSTANSAASIAVAALVVDDLRRGYEWEVVDSRIVRILLDELNADPSGYADPALAVRVGTELDATRVVRVAATPDSASFNQWQVTVSTIGLGAASGAADLPPMLLTRADDAVLVVEERLTPMIVDGLRGRPGEDRRSHRHTSSRDALEAFGRALVALDAGDPASARTDLVVATELDPGFSEARDLLVEASAWLEWERTPFRDALIGLVRSGERQRAVFAQWGGGGSVPQQAAADVGTRDRATLVDVLGLDRGATVWLEIMFRLPAANEP